MIYPDWARRRVCVTSHQTQNHQASLMLLQRRRGEKKKKNAIQVDTGVNGFQRRLVHTQGEETLD